MVWSVWYALVTVMVMVIVTAMVMPMAPSPNCDVDRPLPEQLRSVRWFEITLVRH